MLDSFAPVLPVAVVDDAATAVPLARALLAGGLTAVEVTLRTPAATAAIAAIAAEVPEIAVGAGTVLTAGQVREAVAAGAGFLVTPGSTGRLLDACLESGVPVVPGVATASEALAALERGARELKFFPAEAAGGPAVLAALVGPLPQARFCPTGGVTRANAGRYLALPNVGCVGGAWVAPREAIAARDWDRVTALAAEAAALAGRDPGSAEATATRRGPRQPLR
ncbi:bifunctional 4-hydroxy-2-oxoglutarate aldolase/2-dehydro-3-deoxy-phosphogluconate aldolase [Streptomyces alkaliterrae]|uniref:2-dehydro-3-deoxy-phosphogluconate aldolase n=1 Tax=Streptomyces alkaliterrae TaxID=2213162 RepID=A0A5P0YQQ6_9ACTN|nr:bifunctional 4-hydroxy-2-oxoglutarate aldolase/2-dehydro-3-deoxy-phosphogluconate aldolase [Streptomyces alkaliterrae]MBB1257887.1 bifunctional 4-hydroxy-2-oxoglutarate aldolase/2-dehydro-3-deoxy-phosphogluconate aldolase [Streptomyces alkaliterrae]MQS02643.1 bifunctional 4-hydroxy-2-oxoglutarate aldolase/2-dehydro-3-deoxy-phosphogluconate aldolase [Streptomyces alkaliterrae]